MMQSMFLSGLLCTVLFLPLFLGLGLIITKPLSKKSIFGPAILLNLFCLLASACLMRCIDVDESDFHFTVQVNLIRHIGLDFFIGADAISLSLIILTCFLTLLSSIYLAWSEEENQQGIIGLLLILQSLVNAAFASLNLLLFYIFFEMAIVPMYFIIGIWGGENRIYASYKFFIYTLFASLLFIICIISLYANLGTLNLLELYNQEHLLTKSQAELIWWGIFISFAIKLPIVPLHTWLPSAHVQAPSVGSVILAGVLLKMGGFGFLRILLPILPLTTQSFAIYGLYLGGFAIIYASLVASGQKDIKKMIAYSSIAHMGYVNIGIFSLNVTSISGAIFQMLSHGLICAGLFFVIGSVYTRFHTRQINSLGALADKMPHLACAYMVFTLGSIALPGTSGFIGEFLSLSGTFDKHPIIASCAGAGMVFGAVYLLSLYKRVMFGQTQNPKIVKLKPQESALNVGEKIVFLSLAFCIIFFGIAAHLVLDSLHQPIKKLLYVR